MSRFWATPPDDDNADLANETIGSIDYSRYVAADPEPFWARYERERCAPLAPYCDDTLYAACPPLDAEAYRDEPTPGAPGDEFDYTQLLE